jgi:hypothetical protein
VPQVDIDARSADSLGPLCPYCRHQLGTGEIQACAQCGQLFPWSRDFHSLQDQLKERETSRLRATYTLVEELLAAGRSGKPLSLSAVKGFVTAWLFPRTVIVLGSLLAGAVLSAQTYILYRQTNLLRVQADAAKIEQERTLRERIATTTVLAAGWGRIREIYAAKVAENDCEECLKVLLTDTSRPDMIRRALRPYAQLVPKVEAGVTQVLEDIGQSSLIDSTNRSGLSALPALATLSVAPCELRPDDIVAFNIHHSAVRGALPLIQWIIADETRKVEDFAQNLMHRLRSPQPLPEFMNLDGIGYGQALQELEQARGRLLQQLDGFKRRCDEAIKLDQQRLAALVQ